MEHTWEREKRLCIMLQDYLGKYCDLFEYGGQTHLLVTAFYSKHFEKDFASPEHHQCVINNLKKVFAKFGIPKKFVSDNGPQHTSIRHLFRNEFK